MTPYEAGRLAAERGCYRILMCPKDSREEADWLRGYDSWQPPQKPMPPDIIVYREGTVPKRALSGHDPPPQIDARRARG